MKILEEVTLLYVNSGTKKEKAGKGNNNKFYTIILYEDGKVEAKYGRIGAKPRTVQCGFNGKDTFEQTKREKIKKGYQESDIISSQNSNTIHKTDLYEIAIEQIKTNDQKSQDLIKKMVEENIHSITSNTNITYDDGIFQTPLGIVKESSVEKAKIILDKIQKMIIDKNTQKIEFKKLHENYYTIIPTKIKHLNDSIMYQISDIQNQYKICDSLIDSLKLIDQNKSVKQLDEKVFDLSLLWLKDTQIFNQIKDYFHKSKNNNHGHTLMNASLRNIYEIQSDETNYNKKLQTIGNEMQLWHGTRVANMLSILKNGLLMPKSSPGQKTGAMFGNGLYFSDQSTKSMNYCDGMLWNNAQRKNKIYMFMANVAMGNYYVPKKSTNKSPEKGYHSYFAKANISGVRNNEMIVFDTKQIQLKYILEIQI